MANSSSSNTNTPSDEDNLTRETSLRYSGYLARARAILLPKLRYVAFSSDVGESLRPVMSRAMVNATYALSALYVAGDAVYHGYMEKQQGSPDWVVGRAVGHSLVFQSLASLALPAAIIHTTVHQAHRVLHKVGRFTRWGPSAVGLAIVPFLPLLDPPVEHVVDAVFDNVLPLPPSDKPKHE